MNCLRDTHTIGGGTAPPFERIDGSGLAGGIPHRGSAPPPPHTGAQPPPPPLQQGSRLSVSLPPFYSASRLFHPSLSARLCAHIWSGRGGRGGERGGVWPPRRDLICYDKVVSISPFICHSACLPKNLSKAAPKCALRGSIEARGALTWVSW